MAALKTTVPAQGTAGATQQQPLGEAQYAGTVTEVTIIPKAGVTANGTNFRTIRVLNKGPAGAGSTVIASLALDSPGTDDLTAYDEKTIPLSGTPAVAAGDVLSVDETVAGTGLAHGGYDVQLSYST